MYVAGQMGVSLPNSFSNVDNINLSSFGGTTNAKSSDIDLKTSLMYGAKAGYYFDSLKWQNFNLGVETEVFNTTPHSKQQSVTLTDGILGTGPADLSGANVRVLNWAPVNFVVRYQMGQLEPYAGVGMGVFFARIKDGETGESSSSTNVGLNTQLGLRYLVTKNMSLFGEWKYNRASFDFSESSPTQAAGGFKGDYSAHILAFGVGYHF